MKNAELTLCKSSPPKPTGTYNEIIAKTPSGWAVLTDIYFDGEYVWMEQSLCGTYGKWYTGEEITLWSSLP